jgi:putative isomerase
MAELSIDATPFSRYGAWWAVSQLAGRRAPAGEDGLYVRTFHGGNTPIIRLTPLLDGAPVEVEVEQTPALLTLAAEAGRVEICFDGTRTLRIRGQGLGLRLDPVVRTVLYATDEDHTTFNLRPVRRRYQIERLAGGMQVQGMWQAGSSGTDVAHGSDQGQAEDPRVELAPGPDGTWEIAVDEFVSTWVASVRPDFDTCVATVAREFDDWLAALPPAPEALAQTRKVAGYIDWSAVVEPEGLLKRPAMLMSKNWMTNVWSWDHCFNAIALAAGINEVAWDQLLVVVDHQDAYGAYPDAINDMMKHYNFSKPPIHGWATLEVLKRHPAGVSEARIQGMVNSLAAWTEWWLAHRRVLGHRLPHYLHGNDSGWDNSTMFDQGVPLEAPDLAAFLIVQMDALAALSERLGDEVAARTWWERADELYDALMAEMWVEDHFVGKLATTGAKVESESLIPCIPILLGERLPVPAREALVARIERFVTDWGPATEHPASPKYTRDGYWRGPIWAPSTYLIVDGLERSGYPDLAREIAARFCRLCEKSGLAENYNALTGEALRDPAYTWTSSVFLLLAERLVD